MHPIQPIDPDDPILARIREIIAALPETEETPTWGSPHFRVRNKIFAGYGVYEGVPQISFQTDLHEQSELIQHARYRIAAYTGKYGGVTMLLNGRIPWKAVAAHLETSWRMKAPKVVVKAWDAKRGG